MLLLVSNKAISVLKTSVYFAAIHEIWWNRKFFKFHELQKINKMLTFKTEIPVHKTKTAKDAKLDMKMQLFPKWN